MINNEGNYNYNIDLDRFSIMTIEEKIEYLVNIWAMRIKGDKAEKEYRELKPEIYNITDFKYLSIYFMFPFNEPNVNGIHLLI